MEEWWMGIYSNMMFKAETFFYDRVPCLTFRRNRQYHPVHTWDREEAIAYCVWNSLNGSYPVVAPSLWTCCCFCRDMSSPPGCVTWHTPTYLHVLHVTSSWGFFPNVSSMYISPSPSSRRSFLHLGNALPCGAEPASYYRRWKCQLFSSLTPTVGAWTHEGTGSLSTTGSSAAFKPEPVLWSRWRGLLSLLQSWWWQWRWWLLSASRGACCRDKGWLCGLLIWFFGPPRYSGSLLRKPFINYFSAQI